MECNGAVQETGTTGLVTADEPMDVDRSELEENSSKKDESNSILNESKDIEEKSNDIQKEQISVESKIDAISKVVNESKEETNVVESYINNGLLGFDTTEADFSLERSMTEFNEYSTSEEMLKNSPWELGQLAWARMSIYPFWPCIVTNDPSQNKIFQKVQAKGRSNKTLMIHVHFFNDHNRHSWIPSHHMIPFNGIEDFRKRALLVTDAIRKKEPKFAAALTIKPTTFATWQKAVAEAMDVLYELDMTPLESFEITDQNSEEDDSPVIKKKRKSKDDSKVVKKKGRKSTDSNDNSKSSVNSEIENNLNLDTPPVSPKNVAKTDFRAAHFKKQRQIRKIINKLQPPDFEVFYERSYDSAIRQDPNATDEEVREYLNQVWERMTDVEKLKYRGTYKIARDA